MATVQTVIDWNGAFAGKTPVSPVNVRGKSAKLDARQIAERNARLTDEAFVTEMQRWGVNPELARRTLIAIGFTAAAVLGVDVFAHAAHAAAAAVPAMVPHPDAVYVMAGAAGDDFTSQLDKALAPIKRIIYGFAHEIYFVMMSWGGVEALIGRTQQGFQRMKGATAAYIVLFWVPWICRQVSAAVPGTGF
jgi:hypothetical protein